MDLDQFPHDDSPMSAEEETERAMARAYADLEARLASVRGLLDAVTAERDSLSEQLAVTRGLYVNPTTIEELSRVRELLYSVAAERNLLAMTLHDFRKHLAEESDIGWNGGPNEAMRLATRLEHDVARASLSMRELAAEQSLLCELRELAETAMRAPTDAERLLAASIVCAKLVRAK